MNTPRLAMLALCLSSLTAIPAAAQTAAPASAPAPGATSTTNMALTPQRIDSAGKHGVPNGRDRAAILRAQILLDRARFSPGEIDGLYGSNMRGALAGFQQKHGMRPTGKLDAATWAALNRDTGAVLASYTITEADVAGPFHEIPSDMQEKAKLDALTYSSVEEALGERFHASPALLRQLNPGKDLGRAGETIIVPHVTGSEPLPQAAKVVVDDSSKTLVLFDAAGKVIAQFPTSTGSDKDPLPIGNWKITGVHKDPNYYYNPERFWDADPSDDKAVIKPGPNNPVGVVWMDLSKEHYGIHGTPVPRTIGKTESHGCIRLTNWDAARMADAVSAGTPVVLQQ